MPLLREGIENVRAFFLPDGVAADGHCDKVSRTAVVTWRSTCTDRLHQVYVDGLLGGTSIDVEQRRMVVQVPSSFHSAVHLEVIAVEREDACEDFAPQLDQPAPENGRVRLILLRNQDLPLGATANIYFDNACGQIDYAQPVNASPIPIWACPQDKAGFGMARFAEGDFGYDAAASVGWGRGSFGNGQFGLDADTLEWISPPLSLGVYRFGVKISELRGNESSASETSPIAVVPAATPAARLEAVGFDHAANQLTLRVSDQP